MGLFQIVMPAAGIVFAICSSGIQTAISKFCCDKKNDFLWLISGLLLSIPTSLILTFIVYTNADFIATRFILNEACSSLLKILSLSFPFAAFHNCINGFYFAKEALRQDKQGALPASNAFGSPQAPKRCLLGVSPAGSVSAAERLRRSAVATGNPHPQAPFEQLPRPRKLRILRLAASGKAHSLCCSSSPHATRFSPLRTESGTPLESFSPRVSSRTGRPQPSQRNEGL